MYRWYIVPTEISLWYRQYIAIISDCRLHYFCAELFKEIKEVKEKELKENEQRKDEKICRREIKGKEEMKEEVEKNIWAMKEETKINKRQ